MGSESDQAKALTAMTKERDEAFGARDAMIVERDDAIKARDAMAVECDRLGGKLEALTMDRDALSVELATAKDGLGDSQRALLDMTSERDIALASLETERKDKSQALIDLSKARSDLDAAKRKASVRQKAVPIEIRSVGALDEAEDKRALLDLVQSDLHEVVFSDGEQEIRSLPPIAVAPDAWQLIGRGVLLREAVTVKPDRTIQLAGFGLFNGEGEQIAWCAMAQPVTIAAGQPMRLDRQIVF